MWSIKRKKCLFLDLTLEEEISFLSIMGIHSYSVQPDSASKSCKVFSAAELCRVLTEVLLFLKVVERYLEKKNVILIKVYNVMIWCDICMYCEWVPTNKFINTCITQFLWKILKVTSSFVRWERHDTRWCCLTKSQVWVARELKRGVTRLFPLILHQKCTSSHFWVYTQRNEITISKGYIYSHVFCTIIHNSQDMEINFLSRKEWIMMWDI